MPQLLKKYLKQNPDEVLTNRDYDDSYGAEKKSGARRKPSMEDLERSATGKKEIEEALSTYTPPVGRGDSGKGKNRKRSRPDAKGDEDGPKRQISRSASLTSFGSSDSEQLSLQPSREPSRASSPKLQKGESGGGYPAHPANNPMAMMNPMMQYMMQQHQAMNSVSVSRLWR